MEQPTIQTERLVLRPFDEGDATAVQRLAGEREIADTTLNVPHPYGDGMAEQWIATHADQFAEGSNAVFAIVERESNHLAGAIGLKIEPAIRKAELGYWVGVPYWSRGYATEASEAMLAYGFEQLGLNRIAAQHFTRNPASGRVMQKIGMSYEGTLRQGTMKWGRFEDLDVYSALREEWLSERLQDRSQSTTRKYWR
ncbi:MAG: GNAT family N-acetyltransferase [Woeseiaceae bacterium]|nr:GNAT family N-acetyltransferase [Woeseiaceae bacterium]